MNLTTLNYLKSQPDLHEIIFSGGDPLRLSIRVLSRWLEALAAIPSIRTIRFHSRVPVVYPTAVTQKFIAAIRPHRHRFRLVFVLHANHARELDRPAVRALEKLRAAGFLLLNQSVLLRGVNDHVPALRELSEALLAAGVLPYYLHQLDHTEGVGHFQVPELEGKRLLRQLGRELPGYAVPRYVKEVAGEGGKVKIL